MTIHKPSVVILLVLTGAISATLSGCKHFRSRSPLDAEVHTETGTLIISKMGGGIDIEDAPHGATLSTMGGNIHLGSVGEFAKVKTMGGNVTIEHAEASVDATTMGGNITIKGVDGPLRATTMAGDITAQLVGSFSAQRDVV